MSPEQTRGEPLDSRTDIFSLGCVLYEAATGKVPFSGPSVLSVLHEIATVDPPAPSTVSDKVPQGLDSIITRALAKDKDQRYGSSSDLANALRGLTFANRYQIIRELGRGGMGVVHLAHDPMLERDVAIKVISPDVLSTDAVERFKREAGVVAKMDHPSHRQYLRHRRAREIPLLHHAVCIRNQPAFLLEGRISQSRRSDGYRNPDGRGT